MSAGAEERVSASAGALDPFTCPSCEHPNPPGARFCNGCGRGLFGQDPRADRPGADPLVGQVIGGRYRLEGVLGRGGMGVVYRVEHVRMGKLMAMKLLHGDLARDREVIRRFRREAEAVSKLDHPNTVQVFDFGESDGLTWLVMELLSGRDLGEVLAAETTMDFRRAAQIAWQIAGSVHQAHERGIVHRDLKPENVRLLSDRAEPDFVKVMDFGLAKLRETEEMKNASITREGFLVGTPYYMAPEHIRGETVDPRTDVYALGAVLYKMLTGMPPFWAPTPVAVLTKHLADDVVAPSRRPGRHPIPAEADAIVLKCMEKDPAARYQSMTELRAALSSYLEGVGEGPSTARLAAPARTPPSEGARSSQVATRDDVDRYERGLRTSDFVGRTFLVLLAAITAGVAWWAWGQRPEEAPTTESEPNDGTANADTIWVGTPIEGHLGARMDTHLGDSDVYEVVGLRPTDRFLRIDGSGLPNLDFVVELFSHGRTDPLIVIDGAHVGGPERVPAYPIDPALRYLVRVREAVPFGHLPTENVSDAYVLAVSAVERNEGEETEPNDVLARGEPIAVGEERAAYLGWPGDLDVFCAEAGPARVAVSAVPSLDFVLTITDRNSGSEVLVDAHGGGESEETTFLVDHPFCVSVGTRPEAITRTDPLRPYTLSVGAAH
jgi:serine/threonine protein kinase